MLKNRRLIVVGERMSRVWSTDMRADMDGYRKNSVSSEKITLHTHQNPHRRLLAYSGYRLV